jgi:hypothetical protein
MVFNPGRVLVLERAVTRTEEIEADLESCVLRGWVEVLYAGMPSGPAQQLLERGQLQLGTREDFYRLTDAGWAVINRDRQIALVSVGLAVIGLLLSI